MNFVRGELLAKDFRKRRKKLRQKCRLEFNNHRVKCGERRYYSEGSRASPRRLHRRLSVVVMMHIITRRSSSKDISLRRRRCPNRNFPWTIKISSTDPTCVVLLFFFSSLFTHHATIFFFNSDNNRTWSFCQPDRSDIGLRTIESSVRRWCHRNRSILRCRRLTISTTGTLALS